MAHEPDADKTLPANGPLPDLDFNRRARKIINLCWGMSAQQLEEVIRDLNDLWTAADCDEEDTILPD